MAKYAFILGRQPYLSAVEIVAFLEKQSFDFKLKSFSNEALLVETEDEMNDVSLFSQLGGTIKIIKIIDSVRKDNFENEFKAFLRKDSLLDEDFKGKKIHFGLSFYSLGGKGKVFKFFRKWVRTLNDLIKDYLFDQNLKSAFVRPKAPSLSSVSVVKNKLMKDGFELSLLLFLEEVFIGKTIWVQDFDDFSFRDYSRPERDSQVGMLPPKLARLMINLAGFEKDKVLLDPFCGSGTIITEATLLGFKNLVAADIHEGAVKQTQTNLDWLFDNYLDLKKVEFQLKSLVLKAEELSLGLDQESIDLIVTEPDLGSPRIRGFSKNQTKKEINRLKELYLAFFKEARKVLKQQGKIVIALPVYFKKGQLIRVNILTEILNLGFQKENLAEKVVDLAGNFKEDFLYRRVGQFVGREIFVFRKV